MMEVRAEVEEARADGTVKHERRVLESFDVRI
jgi:hypothetical protein